MSFLLEGASPPGFACAVHTLWHVPNSPLPWKPALHVQLKPPAKLAHTAFNCTFTVVHENVNIKQQ
eukprot:3081852-Rhodomonas_salina.1